MVYGSPAEMQIIIPEINTIDELYTKNTTVTSGYRVLLLFLRSRDALRESFISLLIG